MQPDTANSHIVQLFDTPESAAGVVSTFVAEALADGGNVVAVMSAEEWGPTADLLVGRGLDIVGLIEAGRLTVRETSSTLATIMRHGVPDPELFARSIGPFIAEIAGRGGRLSIYGDMVNRLAEQGDFGAALALEALWNGLRERYRFTLLCGYASVHFGNPRSAPALARICACHSRIHSDPRDMLGSYLLRQVAPPLCAAASEQD